MFSRDNLAEALAKNVAQKKRPEATFLTSVSQPNRGDDSEAVFTASIREYYEKLTGKVIKLDTMIDTVLSKHEKEFMAAFKVHMH
jgi:hypothetical protein